MQCPYLKQNIAKNCLVGFLGGSHSGCWLCGASNNQKIPNAFWDQVCRRNNAQNTMKCNLHPVKHVQLSHICCTLCTATELMVIAVMQQITVIRIFFNTFIKSLSISLKKNPEAFTLLGSALCSINIVFSITALLNSSFNYCRCLLTDIC